jgi:hypothetical protein
VEGVALEHPAQLAELAAAVAQAARGRSQRGQVEVEADDVGAALEGAEAVPPLAAARVEQQLAGADPKPLEIDRE